MRTFLQLGFVFGEQFSGAASMAERDIREASWVSAAHPTLEASGTRGQWSSHGEALGLFFNVEFYLARLEAEQKRKGSSL